GRTPLKLTLPLGAHTLQVHAATETRSLPLTIEAGTAVSQYIDLGTSPMPVGTGRLVVTSDPPHVTVSIDGEASGNTPLTIPALKVGEHAIVVGSGNVAIKRSITILPGETASIVASIGSSSATGGWVAFKTPIELQVFEEGHLIGT